MVNTKNKASPNLSNNHALQVYKKAQTITHTPSWLTTSHNTLWGSLRLKVSTRPICIGSFIARLISEVVIQKAIELFYVVTMIGKVQSYLYIWCKYNK